MNLFIIIFGLIGTVIVTGVDFVNTKFEGEIKTVCTSILMLIALYITIINFSFLGVAITVGLLFSAGGDYFLGVREKLPEKKDGLYFVIGLSLFMIGYLAYGVTFNVIAGFSVLTVVSLIIMSVIAVVQFLTLDKEKTKGLLIPIIAYLVQASILMIGAIGVASAFSLNTFSICILIGSGLLYVSDSLIAHNLFRKPLDRPDLYIMPTYFVGQSLILLSLNLA